MTEITELCRTVLTSDMEAATSVSDAIAEAVNDEDCTVGETLLGFALALGGLAKALGDETSVYAVAAVATHLMDRIRRGSVQ